MTIMTKPSLSIVIKKGDGTKSPLVPEDKECCDEQNQVTIYPSAPSYRPSRKSTKALLILLLTTTMVVMSGITLGMLLYRQYLHSATTRRYQGFCSIPVDIREQLPRMKDDPWEHRVLPLWSSEPIQIISAADDDNLREELDIDDNVEKISVNDNGRTISFIHDFEENTTSIIDDDRCFLMDLDPEVTLTPDFFLVGIQQGGENFDISRVRSTLTALLPAIQELVGEVRGLGPRCKDKPVYRLQRTTANTIRKRSVDAPPHDYIQFAGKHVQEIEIANMAALLEHEAKA